MNEDEDYRDYDEGGNERALGCALMTTLGLVLALCVGVAVLLFSK